MGNCFGKKSGEGGDERKKENREEPKVGVANSSSPRSSERPKPKKIKLSLDGLGDLAPEPDNGAPKIKVFVTLDGAEEMEIDVTAADEILLACNREVNEKHIVACHYGGVEGAVVMPCLHCSVDVLQ